ncbi:anti-sigma factor [Shewanella submarina]|uniref:Anti-sigma-E factor RseA n=1 Tax=Shewanella submarina TaxID=2016376 RepID=A0ABV7G841_9GAMM|nr:RseA family anti-sigma factor [Shewanella submarina]MCL1036926.1 anti-sigma factor [Shewanella submarina]
MDKLGQEWVSAAVDGEVEGQAMADLAADKGSHDKWRNYHMMGDAMRGELPDTINLDLSARIAQAIDDEPAIVAPNIQVTAKAEVDKPRGNVVPLFKQFGQYAIAASVALVAVIGVQNYQQQGPDQEPMSVLSTRPLVGTASPVSLQTGPVQQVQSGNSNEQVYEQRRRLNTYIQDHMLQQRLNSGVALDNSADIMPEHQH